MVSLDYIVVQRLASNYVSPVSGRRGGEEQERIYKYGLLDITLSLLSRRFCFPLVRVEKTTDTLRIYGSTAWIHITKNLPVVNWVYVCFFPYTGSHAIQAGLELPV